MEEKEEERARMDEACDIYEYMEGRKEDGVVGVEARGWARLPKEQ